MTVREDGPVQEISEGRRPPRRAAALRYDQEIDRAPRLVAAGEGPVAEAIVETARRHGVPVYHAPHLAEALVKLRVGTEIPPHLYVAIAKVLAFVYRLDRQREQGRGGPQPRTPTARQPRAPLAYEPQSGPGARRRSLPGSVH